MRKSFTVGFSAFDPMRVEESNARLYS